MKYWMINIGAWLGFHLWLFPVSLTM